MKITKDKLEALYRKYNKREYVSPDPLQFVYDYDNSCDKEIVGLIASSLAYGRVQQILNSISIVLERINSPVRFIINSSNDEFFRIFADFKHRFTVGREIAELLLGIKRIIKEYGSLKKCFSEGMKETNDIVCAQKRFISELSAEFSHKRSSLLPMPESKSANKRLNLFLRWMIRDDEVDLGIWKNVSPERLIVPLDTHMHTISLTLGLTHRKQADMNTALEITESFRKICPEDPVRYDFVLTRFGIRDDMSIGSVSECRRRNKGEEVKCLLEAI